PQRSTFSIGVLPAARSTELSMRRSVSCSVADASLAQYSRPMVLTHRAALPAILIQIKSPNLAIGFHMLSGESGVSIVEDMMTTAKTVTIAAALLLGGASLAMAQNGPPTVAWRLVARLRPVFRGCSTMRPPRAGLCPRRSGLRGAGAGLHSPAHLRGPRRFRILHGSSTL